MIDLVPLQEQLAAAGVNVSRGLSSLEQHVYTHDEAGQLVELPSEADKIVAKYFKETRPMTTPVNLQGVVNEIAQASTIAQLRDAVLTYVEATTGVAAK